MSAEDARNATLALLADRAPDATVCPSEVARALMAADGVQAARTWRDVMPAVHDAIDQLTAEGLVRLSWKGEPLIERAGPYRIGRVSSDGAISPMVQLRVHGASDD